MSHQVYLGLGTNLGDRLANLEAARSALPPDVLLLAASPIYETPPWGYMNQPVFLNQVLHVETSLAPQDLLVSLKQLEIQLGRAPSIPNGPRLIDLDILFYDDLLIETPSLVIPHPRMRGRAFVLLPLADLAPQLLHPGLGLTVSQLLEETDHSGIVLYHE